MSHSTFPRKPLSPGERGPKEWRTVSPAVRTANADLEAPDRRLTPPPRNDSLTPAPLWLPGRGTATPLSARKTPALRLPRTGREQVEPGAAGPRHKRGSQPTKAGGGGGSVQCPLPSPPSPSPGQPRLPVRVLVSPGGRSRRRSVRAIGVFGPLQLHLEPLHADLEAVHGLDG
ncbi:LOW QUALITY PROTEIN: hypothetical protein MC885_014340, partial [Smutsia gigantea]